MLNKNINFTKKPNGIENGKPNTILLRQMCFSSYKNDELKVKLQWVGPGKRKKIFRNVYLTERNSGISSKNFYIGILEIPFLEGLEKYKIEV